jgi:hypothetical protein
MLRAIPFTAAVLLLLSAQTGPARAGILYTASPDYSSTSFSSTTEAGAEQESSAFMLTASATVTGINFWGDYNGNAIFTDSFTIAIYDGVGTPNATAIFTTMAVSLTRTDLGFTGARGNEEYSYTASLATSFDATAGTQYYVAVLDSGLNWLWQLDGSGTNYYRTGGDPTPWITSTITEQDAFQLTGNAIAAAEPASLSLLGLGALSLAGYGWRRRAPA